MLGRFIQPDSIVPEPGNPQSLNRYSYVLNNPLRYTDPTGHCEGDRTNPDNPDAACWGMIGQIERDFPNVRVSPKNWTTEELQAFHRAYSNHIFKHDIMFADRITIYRRRNLTWNEMGLSGYVEYNKKSPGIYSMYVYDFAYESLPTGNGASPPSLLNFEATIIHELTHIADTENPSILESYKRRLAERERGESVLDEYIPTIGWLYDCRNCDPDAESLAISVATYTLMPWAFSRGAAPTDWRYEWLQAQAPKPLHLPIIPR